MNNDPQTTVLACLAKEIGHVAIHAYGKIEIYVKANKGRYKEDHIIQSTSVSTRKYGA